MIPSLNEVVTSLDRTWSPPKPVDFSNDICENVSECVGNTPLIRLSRWAKIHGLGFEVLGKFEAMNPGGSIKDRIALPMIDEIPGGGEPTLGIIESSSGNTAVGLAMVCASQGRKVTVTVPDNQAIEKVRLLERLGAHVVRTSSALPWYHRDSHIGTAVHLEEESPEPATYVNQYVNMGNPTAHYKTTGDEILRQCQAKPPDYLVSTVGTAGTIRGIGERLKEANPSCKIIGVEPLGSVIGHHRDPEWAKLMSSRQCVKAPKTAVPALTDSKPSQELSRLKKPWMTEGIGKDFFPPHLTADVVDEWHSVPDHEAFSRARELMATEGLLIGGSAGAALAAVLAKAASIVPESRVVVILPDGARTYMSTFMDDNWMILHGFLPVPQPPPEWKQPIADIFSFLTCHVRVHTLSHDADPRSLLSIEANLFRLHDDLISKIDLEERIAEAHRSNRIISTVSEILTNPKVHTLKVNASASVGTIELLTRSACKVHNLRNPGILVADLNQSFDRDSLVHFLAALKSS